MAYATTSVTIVVVVGTTPMAGPRDLRDRRCELPKADEGVGWQEGPVDVEAPGRGAPTLLEGGVFDVVVAEDGVLEADDGVEGALGEGEADEEAEAREAGADGGRRAAFAAPVSSSAVGQAPEQARDRGHGEGRPGRRRSTVARKRPRRRRGDVDPVLDDEVDSSSAASSSLLVVAVVLEQESVVSKFAFDVGRRRARNDERRQEEDDGRHGRRGQRRRRRGALSLASLEFLSLTRMMMILRMTSTYKQDRRHDEGRGDHQDQTLKLPLPGQGRRTHQVELALSPLILVVGLSPLVFLVLRQEGVDDSQLHFLGRRPV
mmetsp:Transcript_9377/g.30576  ORF Transcript_9377/g.30576 Transcript_9377/m.30576 type:complete len:318 (+) Transcript_9377:352-1305(+)